MADHVSNDVQQAAPAQRRLDPRVGRLLLVALVAVLVALGLWFFRYETRGRYRMSTNDAYLRADAVTVSPRVSGYVEQVYVADNQDVRAGQPLARVDPRDYRAQTAQFRAQVNVAGATAENVRAGLAEQLAAIDQARAELASADADARYAADEVTRYTPLVETGAEPREKLSSLRNQSARAAAAAAAARAALEGAERRVASLRAQVRQAQAQGEAAQAQLQSADVNLGSTIVRASIDGRIGDKTVRVGQFVTVGTRLMSVVPVQQLYIVANYKETQIGLMRPGQPVEIDVDAMPGVELHGHVESVSPGTAAQFSLLPPQNATGNFTKIVQRVPVRIAIDSPADVRRLLVPGLSVTTIVDTVSARHEPDRIQHRDDAARAAAHAR
ncbi:HlyD family secretion protein [Sphingomonas sp.]|uniref:HlyD family secretion protein n=1 Tax=Sphingomonas sp. TaxID=28214 RepID=UPI003B00BACF